MSGALTQQERFFRFLRKLRSDGRTNMYGAVPYLMRSFALDRQTAFNVVCDWIDRQLEAASVEPLEPTPRKPVRHRAA